MHATSADLGVFAWNVARAKPETCLHPCGLSHRAALQAVGDSIEFLFQLCYAEVKH